MDGPFSRADAISGCALGFVDRNAEGLRRLSDALFYFGELGMQEHRSAALMTELLERHGFAVERGISGFPTGFLATWGQGEPVLAVHTEYDANPSNSQRSGVTEQAEIVPGAPGHCEGHNVNGAVMIAAALAVRHAMERFGVRGTLKVFGAPAEEQILSRPYFVRDGHFDDVDLAFHDHILDEFKSDYGLMQSASISVDFTFRGETAHAAMNPWKGRDALDAVVLMDVGLAQFREHMPPGATAHRVITDGGQQPNVIPARASMWWYFRSGEAEGARALFAHATDVARGAGLMARCELDVKVRAAVWPVRGNQVMAEAIQRVIVAVGMPAWTAAEQAFARTLQQAAGVKADGLRTTVTPMTGPMRQIPASNDCGDISWKVPMARVWFPGNVPHVPFHHWSAGAALATSIAHKGGVAGAKALAASMVEFFANPALVAEAKEGFRKEIGDTVYRPLLPDQTRPPTELNAETMDRYRARMEVHYPPDAPAFDA